MGDRGSHKLILVIIAAIIVLGVILVFSVRGQDSSDSGTAYTNPVADGADEVVEKTSGFSGAMQEFFSGILNYSSMKAENDALKERVAELEEENTVNTLRSEDLKELRELAKVFDYDIAEEDSVVIADVVSYDGSNWLDTFTINVGKKDGVSVDSVVLTGKGLVGKVLSCENHHSKVVSVVNTATSTSFCLSDNDNVLGLVQGDGKGKIEGYILNSRKKIKKGDVLVTSGVGLYPKGFRIGKVTKVEYNDNTQLKTIKAKSAVDFSAVTKVVVVK